MKLDTMQAIEELQKLKSFIPAGQLITIAGQMRDEALSMAIEALRRQAGLPPNLPGYITVERMVQNHLSLLIVYSDLNEYYPGMSCYISREQLALLAAVEHSGRRIVTYTEKTCYKDSEPLVCGLPVIYGDERELQSCIYLVVPEHKNK
ncbi:MAG: hypothetical protein IKW41_06380 [Phascolarctobacterium sp.]|nr:hypothetical protein [Phascolarctobacterium sp.]